MTASFQERLCYKDILDYSFSSHECAGLSPRDHLNVTRSEPGYKSPVPICFDFSVLVKYNLRCSLFLYW